LTAGEWAGLIVSIISIVTGLSIAIRFMVKHYLSELKPDGNGGHNLEGRVRRVEQRTEDIYNLLLELINKK
jgi:hypothetical protein